MDGLERITPAFCGDGGYDVAAANLTAAFGLPGAERLDTSAALGWINRAARQVRVETLRHAYRFQERPDHFENSPAFFSMLVMSTVLCHDFGVRYNPARIRDPKFQDPNCFDPDFSDSRDLFIHGLICGPGGTCASMPVLYAAVGRRLGYPLKLIESKGHLFVRWDDPNGERLNIEATGQGLSCPTDEHYRTWPVAIAKEEEAAGVYMRPLTPEQEVASFRVVRGDCLWENGSYAEALREYARAIGLAPHDPRYQQLILDSYRKYRAIMESKGSAEIAVLAMPREEEIELQRGIVRWHEGLLARSHPGFNLADYGIRMIASALAERPKPFGPLSGVLRPADVDQKGRQGLVATTGDAVHSTGTQRALQAMERAKRQTEINPARQRLDRQPLDRAVDGRFGR